MAGSKRTEKSDGTHPYDPCPGGVPVWNPLMQAREMGYVLEGSILLIRWVRKPTAYKKEKRFIFPPARNTGWKLKMGCYDPVDLLPAKFLMKEITE